METQKFSWAENHYMGDGSVVEVAEMIDIAGDEIIYTGEDCSCENLLVFGNELDVRRDEAESGVADEFCLLDQGFETLPMAGHSKVS